MSTLETQAAQVTGRTREVLRRRTADLARRLRGAPGERPGPERAGAARATPAPDASPAAAPTWIPAGVRVGLADVVAVPDDGPVVVRLWADGARATPAWALPYAYAPRPGDQVVVVERAPTAGAAGGSEAPRRWVIAVARGAGATLLLADGQATLAAGGALRLAGDVAVRVVGEVVTLRARALELAAGALELVADDATEHVRGARQLVAGAVQRVIAGADRLVARRTTHLARGLAKLDGGVTVIG